MDDWSLRITALEAAGWSLVDIAKEVGLSTSAVSDIKRGASKAPRGMAAVRLHALYERLNPVEPAAPDQEAA